MPATKTYVLIDLQNRRPAFERVEATIGTSGEAWVFFGDQELEFLPNYMQIGSQVSIVPIARPGKNSLDFHLVLYLGYLVAKNKTARFIVVAADRDYDAAIAHAQGEGIDVTRVADLPAALPARQKVAPAKTEVSEPRPRRANPSTTISAIYSAIREDIRGPNRPRSLKALTARIKSRFGKAATTKGIDDVLARLETVDVLKIVNGELKYVKEADSETAKNLRPLRPAKSQCIDVAL